MSCFFAGNVAKLVQKKTKIEMNCASALSGRLYAFFRFDAILSGSDFTYFFHIVLHKLWYTCSKGFNRVLIAAQKTVFLSV
jgi:hypothetical protein